MILTASYVVLSEASIVYSLKQATDLLIYNTHEVQRLEVTMIDFLNLTPNELKQIGIRFESLRDTNAFITIIKKEYTSRMKKILESSLTEEEKKAYESLEADDEIAAWAKTHSPAYQDAVKKVADQLEKELLQNKNRIPGTVYWPPKASCSRDYFVPDRNSADCHITDPKGIPAFLRRRETALSKGTKPYDLSKSNDKGIPLYLQKKDKKKTKLASIHDVINSLSSKTFPINRRGYNIGEVHDYLERIIMKLRKSPIDRRIIEDIENVEFGINNTAYDPKSVDEYLDRICDSLEAIINSSNE